MGSGRWFVATETIFIALQAAFLHRFVPTVGVAGTGYSFALTYLLYTLGMLWVGHRLIGFRWSGEVVRLLVGTTALVAASLTSTLLVPTPWRWVVGAGICTIGTLISARGLVRRLGPEHRISSVLARIPGWRWIVGV
jgi:PST family polysaccharide transporter